MDSQAPELDFKLPKLTPSKQKVLCNFAEQLLTCQQKIINCFGQSILQFMLENNEIYFKNKHYPQGDRIDFQNGGQYFYHCHRENYATDEHGHFHCYLRRTAIPKNIKPIFLPKKPVKESQQMTHIIAIGLNRLGQPIRLFTLNHWVTRDVAYKASLAQNLTQRFKLQINDSSKWEIIDKWIEGVVQIFMPQIVWLQRLRSQKIQKLSQQTNSDENIFTNTKIEEVSSLPIDLIKQLKWLTK